MVAVLGDSGRGAGVFLLGHSAGCELAVRLAADERAATAGVFGLAMSGTGLRYTERAGEILKKATVTLRPVGLRELLWQPAHLYPPEVFAAVGKTPSGARYEADVTRKWPVQDFPALAPQVRVPVLFSVAEHERIWRSDPRSLADIAALFTASPRFELDEQPGAGHNLSLSVYAAAYHLKVLSFLEECAVTRECSTTELEAG